MRRNRYVSETRAGLAGSDAGLAMETPSHRARRLIRLGAAVLLLALASLAVAVGALVDAERRAGLARLSIGRRAAVRALADALELASRSEASARLVLGDDFRLVTPAPPRRLVATPRPRDPEGGFLLGLASAKEPPLPPRRVLAVAVASEDASTRLLAAAAGAALETREDTGRAGEWSLRAGDLRALARTREGIFLGLLRGDQAAVEHALQAVGTPDETAAAALLVGTGTEFDVIGRRAKLVRLHGPCSALLAGAPEHAVADDGTLRVRVAYRANGGAVIGVRRAEQRLWHVAVLPPERVLAIANGVLPAHGARLGAPPGPGAEATTVALPGDSGLWVEDVVGGPESSSGFAPLLLVGMALAAAASLGAFGAFTRSVRRNARLETLRSEFVATVGHELRTPVAVMRTSAETLALERAATPEDRRSLASAIVREAERLSHLLGNVLDFARMESGKRRLDPRPLDLGDLVRATVDGYASTLERAGFRVDVEIEPELPPVPCDRAAIGAALTNLIENAVKFSPDSHEARVRVSRAGDGVAIEVEDHGIGVPDGEKAAVFERFRRGSAHAVQETRGTGIGLSLVQHAAEAHGGSVSVHDTPGGGATFRLRLPFGEHGATGGEA